MARKDSKPKKKKNDWLAEQTIRLEADQAKLKEDFYRRNPQYDRRLKSELDKAK